MRCFFNDPATTEIYTLSLHDALPISQLVQARHTAVDRANRDGLVALPLHHELDLYGARPGALRKRSEEHTSELQSRQYLVCRLLLEKKLNSSHANISSALFCFRAHDS